jgi:hypothetical protein
MNAKYDNTTLNNVTRCLSDELLSFTPSTMAEHDRMSDSRATAVNKPRPIQAPVASNVASGLESNARTRAATPGQPEGTPQRVVGAHEHVARDSPSVVGTLLPLIRPLSVFPASTEVRFGPGFLVSPDTLCQVAYGYTVENLIRRIEPTLHLQLRKLKYSVLGTHRPTLTTQKLLAQTFSAAFTQAELQSCLDGDGEVCAGGVVAAWRTMRKGFDQKGVNADDASAGTAAASPSVKDIASHLAAREASWERVLSLHAAMLNSNDDLPDMVRVVQEQLDRGKKAWAEFMPRLSKDVFLFVEEALRCIVMLERRWARGGAPEPLHADSSSTVLRLLRDGRRPVGHWLEQVAQACGEKNLRGLEMALLRANVQTQGKTIAYDRLKKWSACKPMLLRVRAMDDMLEVVRDRELAQSLESGYFLARVLTFLCDLVCSGIVGAPSTWADVQRQLHRRYGLLQQEP